MGLDSQLLNNAVNEPLLSEIKSFLQEKSSVPKEKPITISGTFYLL